jgi:hypothetical protein
MQFSIEIKKLFENEIPDFSIKRTTMNFDISEALDHSFSLLQSNLTKIFSSWHSNAQSTVRRLLHTIPALNRDFCSSINLLHPFPPARISSGHKVLQRRNARKNFCFYFWWSIDKKILMKISLNF